MGTGVPHIPMLTSLRFAKEEFQAVFVPRVRWYKVKTKSSHLTARVMRQIALETKLICWFRHISKTRKIARRTRRRVSKKRSARARRVARRAEMSRDDVAKLLRRAYEWKSKMEVGAELVIPTAAPGISYPTPVDDKISTIVRKEELGLLARVYRRGLLRECHNVGLHRSAMNMQAGLRLPPRLGETGLSLLGSGYAVRFPYSNATVFGCYYDVHFDVNSIAVRFQEQLILEARAHVPMILKSNLGSHDVPYTSFDFADADGFDRWPTVTFNTDFDYSGASVNDHITALRYGAKAPTVGQSLREHYRPHVLKLLDEGLSDMHLSILVRGLAFVYSYAGACRRGGVFESDELLEVHRAEKCWLTESS